MNGKSKQVISYAAVGLASVVVGVIISSAADLRPWAGLPERVESAEKRLDTNDTRWRNHDASAAAQMLAVEQRLGVIQADLREIKTIVKANRRAYGGTE